MPLARLSTKSQVVIPASIRKSLGLRAGDLVEIDTQDQEIIIRKAAGSAVEQLLECISDVWEGYDTELESMREDWDR